MSPLLRDTPLSPREREVACLIGEGFTVGQIAKQLDLSVKTISTFRARVLEKLGLPTTAALVRYVVERQVRAEYEQEGRS